MKPLVATEAEVHRSVVEHLRWRSVPDCFAWHTPNGGYRTRREAGLFKSMLVVPGVPDLLLLREGQLRGLELKREGGRLSPDQLVAHEALRRAGAVVATCYDVDQALDQLAEWGLLR